MLAVTPQHQHHDFCKVFHHHSLPPSLLPPHISALFYFWFLFVSETVHVAQANNDLELLILPLPDLQHSDHRCVTLKGATLQGLTEQTVRSTRDSRSREPAMVRRGHLSKTRNFIVIRSRCRGKFSKTMNFPPPNLMCISEVKVYSV